MPESFAGKTVIITGASTGIGADCAIEFAKRKANLVLNARNLEALEKTKNVCLSHGLRSDQVVFVLGDLVEDKVQQAIVDKAIEKFGKIDILINNAAKTETINVVTVRIKDFDEILNLNLRAPIGLSLIALPHLIKTKGNIVNISSVASIRPVQSRMAYSTSKAGLDMFTRTLAFNAARYGVRVNSVNPAIVPTNFGKDSNQDPVIKQRIRDTVKTVHPLGRVGKVEEVTNAVLFLASDKAAFTTGQLFLGRWRRCYWRSCSSRCSHSCCSCKCSCGDNQEQNLNVA